jgi:DNA repair protein RecO (recombination protein O)
VYSEKNSILDLREGQFVGELPPHPHVLEGSLSYHTAQLLRVQRPEELQEIALNQEVRRVLLDAFRTFYALQIPDFGEMRTLAVLQTVFS